MRSSVLVIFFLMSNNAWSMDQQKVVNKIEIPSLKGKLPVAAAVVELESKPKLESPLVIRIRRQSLAEQLKTEQVCKEAKGGSLEVVAKI